MANVAGNTYEEIKDIVVYMLLNPDKSQIQINQFSDLKNAVNSELARRLGQEFRHAPLAVPSSLNEETVREVFWDLFRLGFITLGMNASNPSWPWFKLSRFGQTMLNSQKPWRFHDSSSYILLVKQEIPDILDLTLNYLQEATDCFYSGCYFASTVMLGVAAEAEFLELLNAASNNSVVGAHFVKSIRAKNISDKIEYFLTALKNVEGRLSYKSTEDFYQNFLAIQSVIRIARNEAGHPIGSIAPSRELLYVNLQLFIPFARQLMRLRKSIESLDASLSIEARV